jgi:hypothetical protein
MTGKDLSCAVSGPLFVLLIGICVGAGLAVAFG